MALGDHSAVNRICDVDGEVHPLDAHVGNLNTELLGIFNNTFRNTAHDGITVGRQNALHRPFCDFLVQCGLNDGRQTRFQIADVRAAVADESTGVGDAPLDQPINHQALLLGRKNGSELCAVQSLNAAIHEHDILERRGQLEFQTRLGDDLFDFAKCVNHCKLTLVHDEERRASDHQRHQAAKDKSKYAIHDVFSL